ncbi:MAG: AsmA family protein, partial [Alphaproteobacteria bacterium]|nr:AsmA family protein [Alphaproteobacteria bacterium]
MRLILFVVSLIALLFAVAIIGPSFIDWDKYKPQIITQVKNATGLDVTIDGDLSLAVLPSPRLKVEGLSVAAPRKIRFENLLTMKSAQISVAIMPLLQKKVEVQTITLIQPDIQVEMMSDGTPSWMSDKLQKMQNGAKSVGTLAPREAKQ